MVRLGASRVFPTRFTVRGVSTTWQQIARLPGSELPTSGSSVPYTFLVFGTVGAFAKDLKTSGTVEVGLFNSNGIQFAQYVERLEITQVNLSAADDRGFGFMMVLQQPNWNTADSLDIRGRIINSVGFGIPSFIVEGVTMIAFDETTLTSSRFVRAFASYGTGTAMAFSNQTPDNVLATSAIPWTSGTEKWLAFFAQQVTPGSGSLPYNIWMGRRTLGTWGSITDLWGRGASGQLGTSAWGVPNIARHTYWQGLFRVFDVTNATTDIGIQNQNLYTAAQGPASLRLISSIFALKIDEDDGYQEAQELLAPSFYGAVPQFKRYNWTQPGPMRTTVLMCGCPYNIDGPGKGFETIVRQNEARIKSTEDPLAIYQHDSKHGNADLRGAVIDMFEGQNFPTLEGRRNPIEVNRPKITNIIGTALTPILLTRNHGKALFNNFTVTIAGVINNVPSLTGPTPFQAAITGSRMFFLRNLRTTSAGSSGTAQFTNNPSIPIQTIFAAPVTYVQTDIGHGLGVLEGTTVVVTIAGVSGNVPDINGNHLAVITGPSSFTIPVTTTRVGSFTNATVRYAGPVWSNAFLQVVSMALDDAITPNKYALEAIGPTIKIALDRESPAVGSLNELTIDPSFPLDVERFREVREVPTPLGYRMTWPRFLTPRRVIRGGWLSLTLAQRNTLRTFFAAQGQMAFRWTRPGDIERPYVAIKHSFPEPDLGNNLYSGTIEMAELVYTQ